MAYVRDSERMTNIRELRDMCDAYFDSRPNVFVPGRATTLVNIDYIACDVKRGAQLALDLYNREMEKNFNLVKVVKLNFTSVCNCMTVCAQDGESDECHLFRCIFDFVKEEVVLCDIKCNSKISILVDNVDDYVKRLGRRDEDQPSDTWKKDHGDDAALGSDGVIHVSPTIFRIMGEESISNLRKRCEDYLDPCLYDKCGMMKLLDISCFGWVTEYAKLAISIYNEKEQKNFMLVQVEKLYSFVDRHYPHYYCMTFWAQNGTSVEYRLFRAVCIKHDDEVPAKQEDACVQEMDLSKYIALDVWDADGVASTISAIYNSLKRRKTDVGVGSAGGFVGIGSGFTAGSCSEEKSLK